MEWLREIDERVAEIEQHRAKWKIIPNFFEAALLDAVADVRILGAAVRVLAEAVRGATFGDCCPYCGAFEDPCEDWCKWQATLRLIEHGPDALKSVRGKYADVLRPSDEFSAERRAEEGVGGQA